MHRAATHSRTLWGFDDRNWQFFFTIANSLASEYTPFPSNATGHAVGERRIVHDITVPLFGR